MVSKILYLLLIVTILQIFGSNGLIRTDSLVHTKLGLIKGITSKNGNYSMFMGIPYATVNKTNPFGDALPLPVFETTYDADDDSAMCPQVFELSNTILGSLDCLHLNIYVPYTATSTNRVPVMVWIHGGFFRSSFSGRLLYGPGFIVRHNVILVTLNYRLGPYGFMCLNEPEVSGNQGLKDQLMALRWINENIESFGGDVNQITLFGQSAGGHSVDLHLLSPKEKLYSKAILETGSAQARTVLVKPDKNAHFKLAAYLGFDTTDVKEALTFLSRAHTNLVIAASVELGILFKPCVELEFDGTDAFITENWLTARAAKVANMPILLGFNRDERMLYYDNIKTEYFENLDIFARYLTQNFNKGYFNIMYEIVRHFYLGDEPLGENMKQQIIHFDSDFTYIHPVQRTIQKYIESNAGDIFYYMFAYEGQRNLEKVVFNKIAVKGTAHGDEVGYLFDMQYLSDENTQEDQLIIDRMTTMWTNFAKFGDPTPQTSDLLPIKWSPIGENSLNYLKIDEEMSMDKRPFNERMAFWDIFYKLNAQFQIDLK